MHCHHRELPVQDIVTSIKRYNAGRDPQRLAMKYANLRRDPFVFLRGSCHRFYETLPRDKLLRAAPLAWACGDLHLENFGSYKGDNRLVYFDINDFDEAALAPASWDVLRLLSSILVGEQVLHLKAGEAAALCQRFLQHYAATLASGKARWIDRDLAQGLVGDLLGGLRERTRADFLDARTELHGKRRRIRIDGRKALPVTDKQRDKLTRFMAEFAATQENPRFFRLRDVARRIAGNGSLGLDRYVLLVEGRGSPDHNYLLDIKQALPSSLQPYLSNPQPRWASEAARVVAVQQRMQAIPMAFLHAVKLGKRACVLRDLQPSEDRVALGAADHKRGQTAALIDTLAELLAWAQLRSAGREGAASVDELIEFANGRKWPLRMLDLAHQCAARVDSDWQDYCRAYDAGAFAMVG
jgi:uncharacterized protein (DUF2252 family)